LWRPFLRATCHTYESLDSGPETSKKAKKGKKKDKNPYIYILY